jgi:asparagine synthase (glutamine-hydrolysing)
MCGINGLFHFDRSHAVSEDQVHAMRRVIQHRGPDDFGIHLDGHVGLGFNRLSIIDLSGGHQPMCNEDGTVWIVFNGEIYNFEELRQEMLSRGHRFQTRSDTETLVHLWEEYGERSVERLRGMFAYAIWDSRQRVLFMARDRLGIKPLYYFEDRERFAFASEMKCLLELPDMPREVDPRALAQYLRHRYVIAPDTMLRGIRKLPPGHSLTVRETGSAVRRYWEMPLDGPRQITEAEALEEFGALLDETMRQHLVSDVPLGAFLSGGLDSSSVVALMSKIGVQDIKTFSIGYDSPESELPYARIVADAFHTDHHELRLSATGFRDVLPKIVWYMDEPVGNEASLPLYLISEFARKKVTVALSGEGADEILGGYDMYRVMLAYETLNRVPLAGVAGKLLKRFGGEGKLQKYGSMLGLPLEDRYGGLSRVFPQERIPGLMLQSQAGESPIPGIYRQSEGLPVLARMNFLDIKTWLVDDLLVKADRMSMAASLELRVPFLDHKVVEFAFRLPSRLKVRGNTPKYLLKKYMAPMLPPAIINRAKKGFPVPVNSWFRNDLAGFAREILLDPAGPSMAFFARAELERLLAAHQQRDCSQQVYALLVFDQWHRLFVKSPAERLAPVA